MFKSLLVYQVLVLSALARTRSGLMKKELVNVGRPAHFSVNSVKDATLPMLHPIIAAGSDRCEMLKSFFGLTYEQLRHEKIDLDLHIDYISKKGYISFNLTDPRLNRVFGNDRSVIVLIHGFMESSEGMMVQGLAPELLKREGLTILALDGRKIINFEYFRSSTYVRFMGEKLGTLLAQAINIGQPASNITLIGHSLGAHIAGVAGKQVSRLTHQLLGRIVALDPAGLCFSNVSAQGKLDAGDAAYVDAVHTSAGMLGLNEPVGHKDFYPNGGMTQNGCYMSTCDHTRAWIYFMESLIKPNIYPARKCDSWAMFKQGNCSKNEIAFMGLESVAGSNGSYYLNTGSLPPYGLGTEGSL